MEIIGGLTGFLLLESAHSVVISKLHETMVFYNKTTHITHIWDGLQSSVITNICYIFYHKKLKYNIYYLFPTNFLS